MSTMASCGSCIMSLSTKVVIKRCCSSKLYLQLSLQRRSLSFYIRGKEHGQKLHYISGKRKTSIALPFFSIASFTSDGRVVKTGACLINDEDENTATEWVPPNRPLTGDAGQSHIVKRAQREYINDSNDFDNDDLDIYDDEEDYYDSDEDEDDVELVDLDSLDIEGLNDLEAQGEDEVVVDWLQTRRSIIQPDYTPPAVSDAVDMMRPDDAIEVKRRETDLPILKHKLLTSDEIIFLLKSMGGYDITLLPIDHDLLGADVEGMIICSSNVQQIRSICDVIVRNMRLRSLEELDVVGASLGIEAGGRYDTWQVVDCCNNLVHVLDEKTRSYINLESLWGPESTDELRTLDLTDEDSVMKYIEANPTPDGYLEHISGTYTAEQKELWSNSLNKLKQNKLIQHQPYNISSSTQEKNRKKKKRK